jgi:ABC-type multidrug transport system fused ATPase/permease subunit
LAATSRLAPALLRIQQSLVQIQINIGIAEPTLLILRRAEGLNPVAKDNDFHDSNYFDFVPSIKIKNISFIYPDSNLKVLNNISLEIAEGTFVAVVGPSGSGKTTLIDILLGMHEPLSGTVQISGLPPFQAIYNWPGAISYVPQSVKLINGTIRENITFGYPKESDSDQLLENSIRSASLDEFVSGLSDGVETLIGKNGIGMSGGQAQRIGIARALFTNPKLLILDEATSSLDNETELDVSKSISQLKGKVTLVVIAHRLSTIRKADKVVYLDKGNLVIEGTFDEVRRAVPGFDVHSEVFGSEN